MRKSNREIKEREVIETLLKKETLCRLALVDNDKPYLLAFNYGYEGGHLYIHSAPEGRKIDILKLNPEVCFEIENSVKIIDAPTPCGWTTSYRSVIGYARAEILTGTDEKIKGLGIIMRQHGAKAPYHYEPGNLERMVIIRLRISNMTAKQSSDWVKRSSQGQT